MCEQLWEHYNVLFGIYEAFNEQSLVLKGWSVTVSLAAIVAAYSETIGTQGRIAVWGSAISAAVFWLTDAYWKSYQEAYRVILKEMESTWSCTEGSQAPTLMVDWKENYHMWDFLTVLHLPSVALPHAFVLVLGVALAVFYPPKAS